MNQSILARLVVSIPAAVFFIESIVFLASPFNLPRGILGILYPQLTTLSQHCSISKCIYEPTDVASLYVVQLVTYVMFCLVFYIIGRKNRGYLDSTSIAICAIVIFGSLLDYVFGNFSFRKIWMLPNSVATSPLGLFRYAVMFSIASICAAILANVIRPKERTDANS